MTVCSVGRTRPRVVLEMRIPSPRAGQLPGRMLTRELRGLASALPIILMLALLSTLCEASTTMCGQCNCEKNDTQIIITTCPNIPTINLWSEGVTDLTSNAFALATITTYMYLIGNKLSQLPANLFEHNKQLTNLYLNNNQLSQLPEGLFEKNTQLTYLRLDFNQLSQLPAGLFENNKKLNELHLYCNQLSQLPAGLFENNRKLNKLFLQYNQLTQLPEGLFDNTSLTHLNLQNNNLTMLPPGIFQSNLNLRFVNLGYNNLATLRPGLFQSNRNLYTVHLQNNSLTTLPPGLFQSNLNLNTVNLANNTLATLPEALFGTVPETLYIANNRIVRDPRLCRAKYPLNYETKFSDADPGVNAYINNLSESLCLSGCEVSLGSITLCPDNHTCVGLTFNYTCEQCQWQDVNTTGYESIADNGTVTCSRGYAVVPRKFTPFCEAVTNTWKLTDFCKACSWKDKHATGYESISDTGNVTCSQGYRPVHDANTPKCNQTTGAWEFTAVCEDIDECAISNGSFCNEQDTCYNTIGSFVCCNTKYSSWSNGLCSQRYDCMGSESLLILNTSAHSQMSLDMALTHCSKAGLSLPSHPGCISSAVSSGKINKRVWLVTPAWLVKSILSEDNITEDASRDQLHNVVCVEFAACSSVTCQQNALCNSTGQCECRMPYYHDGTSCSRMYLGEGNCGHVSLNIPSGYNFEQVNHSSAVRICRDANMVVPFELYYICTSTMIQEFRGVYHLRNANIHSWTSGRPSIGESGSARVLCVASNNCTSPPVVNNSIVTWIKSQPSGSDMLTSGHVMVQCNKNYVFGSSLPLVCAGLSGQWTSGDRLSRYSGAGIDECVPTCVLPTINNSVSVVAKYVPQNGLMAHAFDVTCRVGYNAVPSTASSKCTRPGGEFIIVPECEKCQWQDVNTTGYESITDNGTVTCSRGYVVVPRNFTPFCPEVNNTWTLTDFCEVVKCFNDPGIPVNGTRRNFTSVYLSVVNYECAEGYAAQSRICEDNGTWSGQRPVCKETFCPHPGNLSNGSIFHQGLRFDTVLVYLCNYGYRLQGSRFSNCLTNHTWSTPIPTCTVVSCPDPGSPVNGMRTLNSLHYNSVVVYQCNMGYDMSGSMTSQCLANKAWSAPLPVCNIVSCPDPGSPVNGSGTLNSQHYNSVVSYQCDIGYDMSGSLTRRCLANKTWSATLPVCEIIQCPVAGTPKHGSQQPHTSVYQSVVRYACDEGYNMSGSPTRTCTEHAAWIPAMPICTLITCADPGAPVNGRKMLQGLSYNNTVTFSCDTGFNLTGMAVQHCAETGKWSATQPTCVVLTCPDPIAPTHGSRVVTDLSYGKTVNYSCDIGYEINGTKDSECHETGRWSTSAPTCDIVECRDPGTPDHGSKDSHDLTYESTANYNCDTGYYLIGSPSINCTEEGNWTSDLPKCEVKHCSDPGPPENGIRLLQGYSYLSTVAYKCDLGYNINGSVFRVCSGDKTWIPDKPTCEINECQDPGTPANGTRELDGLLYGDEVLYSCRKGFRMNGSDISVCTEHGNWSAPLPFCQVMSADSGESGPSGSAFTVGVSVGIGLLLAGAVLILLVLQRYRPEKLKTAKIKLETAKGQMQTVKEQLVQSKQNAMDQFSIYATRAGVDVSEQMQNLTTRTGEKVRRLWGASSEYDTAQYMNKEKQKISIELVTPGYSGPPSTAKDSKAPQEAYTNTTMLGADSSTADNIKTYSNEPTASNQPENPYVSGATDPINEETVFDAYELDETVAYSLKKARSNEKLFTSVDENSLSGDDYGNEDGIYECMPVGGLSASVNQNKCAAYSLKKARSNEKLFTSVDENNLSGDDHDNEDCTYECMPVGGLSASVNQNECAFQLSEGAMHHSSDVAVNIATPDARLPEIEATLSDESLYRDVVEDRFDVDGVGEIPGKVRETTYSVYETGSDDNTTYQAQGSQASHLASIASTINPTAAGFTADQNSSNYEDATSATLPHSRKSQLTITSSVGSLYGEVLCDELSEVAEAPTQHSTQHVDTVYMQEAGVDQINVTRPMSQADIGSALIEAGQRNPNGHLPANSEMIPNEESLYGEVASDKPDDQVYEANDAAQEGSGGTDIFYE
ncbi:sushi, von Willebrand factor type A, EGF and pentraxin domain-containing protein 1-like isoform X4 [Sycon ciliatum]|uniref:sushi, von Willebrand factor type A, EGF and pentraxin domain-containing protein 1-like isoform X4 n=1 Tax=Sycon ciliatum TaxID=27933 RepID=UPI0031F6B941